MATHQNHDDHDERNVQVLRRLLNVEEPVPLGMRSRVEARLARSRREDVRPGLSVPAVLGLTGFVGGSALYGLEVHSGTLVALLALGSALYGVGIRRLVVGGSPRRPGEGDVGTDSA